MGKMRQTNHEAMREGRPVRLYGRGTNPCVTCWKDPYIGPERGKLREVNPMSAINTDEEKSGKRRTEARGNSAPLPHMAHSPRILSGSSRVPGHWEAKSSAVPGRHTAGWANLGSAELFRRVSWNKIDTQCLNYFDAMCWTYFDRFYKLELFRQDHFCKLELFRHIFNLHIGRVLDKHVLVYLKNYAFKHAIKPIM